MTTQCSRNTVVWTKSDQELLWHRMRMPSLGDLAGCWVNSQGQQCGVFDSTCTFSDGDRHRIETSQSNDTLVMNGFTSVHYTGDSVLWMKSDEELWWYRHKDPSLEALAGVWVNMQYQVCQVEGGKCVFGSSIDQYPIQVNGLGTFSVNGWNLNYGSQSTMVVLTQSGQHERVMHRVRMPSLGDLAGCWVNSQGQQCGVFDSTCTFSDGDRHRIETSQSNDTLVMNGFTSVHYTGDSVLWMNSDEELWWYRRKDPSLEALAGVWVNPDGDACQVENGTLMIGSTLCHLSIQSNALDAWVLFQTQTEQFYTLHVTDNIVWWKESHNSGGTAQFLWRKLSCSQSRATKLATGDDVQSQRMAAEPAPEHGVQLQNGTVRQKAHAEAARTVSLLMEAGFDETACIEAVSEGGNNDVHAAMDWLLAKQDMPSNQSPEQPLIRSTFGPSEGAAAEDLYGPALCCSIEETCVDLYGAEELAETRQKEPNQRKSNTTRDAPVKQETPPYRPPQLPAGWSEYRDPASGSIVDVADSLFSAAS